MCKKIQPCLRPENQLGPKPIKYFEWVNKEKLPPGLRHENKLRARNRNV